MPITIMFDNQTSNNINNHSLESQPNSSIVDANMVTKKVPSPLMRSIQLGNIREHSKQSCFMAIHDLVNDTDTENMIHSNPSNSVPLD